MQTRNTPLSTGSDTSHSQGGRGTFSSAGLKTHRLPDAPPAGSPDSGPQAQVGPHQQPQQPHSPRQTSRRNTTIAVVLIVAGVLMLLGKLVPIGIELSGGLVFLTIASCFLFFAFWKHIYGLLIPGCIIAGFSLGVPFAPITGGVSVLWGLAVGFLAILYLGERMFNKQSHWPVYPAVPLFALGAIGAIAQLPALFASGFVLLPLLLIGLGLYLGWGRTQKPGR